MATTKPRSRRSISRAEIVLLAAAWVNRAGIEVLGIPSGVHAATRKALEAMRIGGATTATLQKAGLDGDDIRTMLAEVEAGTPTYEDAVSAITAATVAPADLLARYGIVTANTIQREAVSWLWEGYIPLGAFTILEGNPDVGKTMVALAIAAAVSDGRPMPSGKADKSNACPVLYLTAEDSLSQTVIPRLRAAGADLPRVQVKKVNGADLLLPTAIEDLRALVRQTGCRLVVLDPLNGYLDASRINVNSEQDVRQALQPLRALAEQEGIAIIGLRHLNKASDKPALHRGAGSIALTAVARSVLLVARHPDDPGLRVLLSQKCNLIEDSKKQTLGFRIAKRDDGGPHLEWLPDPVQIDAEELLAPRKPGPTPDTLEKAKAYLRDHLSQGPKRRRDIIESGKKVHLNERTLDRAADAIGVVSTPQGKERLWGLRSGEGRGHE